MLRSEIERSRPPPTLVCVALFRDEHRLGSMLGPPSPTMHTTAMLYRIGDPMRMFWFTFLVTRK